MDYEALEKEIALAMNGLKTLPERVGHICALALVDMAWSLDSIRDSLEALSLGDDESDEDDEIDEDESEDEDEDEYEEDEDVQEEEEEDDS